MSQVAKLKELLFQPESEAIASLARRVEDVYERAGSETRFEESMARTIDGALRHAEQTKHEQLAAALAPIVVKTVKTEIANSSDDIAQALYPSMGRMVRDYVASQIKEMTERINRSLEENAFMLRLNALVSGRSAAELALADSQRLTAEDVYLIRRGTGELLARWPAAPGNNSDHVFGGVLTAINDFVSEAFKSDGSALRDIDLGDSRVYLRVSPSYLLAARCKGADSAAAEKVLDEEFLRLMERCSPHIEALAKSDGTVAPPAGRQLQPMLAELSERVTARLTEIAPPIGQRSGVRPLTILATLIGLVTAVLVSWHLYTRWVEASVAATARDIIEATPSMLGYPAAVNVQAGGSALTLQGLTPSLDVQNALVKRIAAALPDVEVRNRLNPLPEGTDFRPMLAELKDGQSAFEAEVKLATDRQLRQLAAGLLSRAARVLETEAKSLDAAAADAMTKFAKEVSSLSVLAEAQPAALSARAEQLEAELSAASLRILDTGPNAASGGKASVVDVPASGTAQSVDILTSAERVGFAAQTLADRSSVRRRLAEVAAQKAALTSLQREIDLLAKRGLTPREALVQFARANAVFFGDGTGFRDPAGAMRVLDELARLIMADGSLVRLVGYTDDAGSVQTNAALGQARAEAVAAELVRRGVQSNRLVVLRRTSPEYNVSLERGARSPNRRVEFEVGFIGEGSEG